MSTLSRNLKKARAKAGLTQKEVSKLTNINRATIANWETGRAEPDSDSIKVLAELYQVSLNYLFGLPEKQDLKPMPDLDAPLREKNRADALLKISELDSEFSLPDEIILSLIRKVREKYGQLPKEGGIAAHGPEQPGTGALRKEDFD